MGDFYVTLPSNDISDPDNTIASYKTYLPKTLRLDGKWEVGLAEISYTKSWYNVTEKNWIMLTNSEGRIEQSPVYFYPGNYESVYHLLFAINTLVSESFDSSQKKVPQLGLDESSKRVHIIAGRNNENLRTFLFLDQELDDILGFSVPSSDNDKYRLPRNIQIAFGTQVKCTDNEEKKCAPRIYDMKAGIHTLMIYTNIVEPCIVGSYSAQLLRSISVDDSVRFGEDINVVFDSPYYIPVSYNEITQIQINIKDENNEFIKFQTGRAVVVLHFRKKP